MGFFRASATLFSNGHGQSPCKGLSSNQASLNQLSFPFFSFTRKGCSDLSSSVISPVMPLIPTCERLEKPLREAIYTAVFINNKLSKPMGWFIWEMICKCWIFHIYVLGFVSISMILEGSCKAQLQPTHTQTHNPLSHLGFV